MSFNFVEKVMYIGGNGTPDLQFYKKAFNLGSSGETPSWQDIILSGNTALTLTNALANGLNYLKLFGDTEQVPQEYIDGLTLFGGTEQRNLPSEYTQVEYVTNAEQTKINTGIKFDFSKNYEIELKVRGVSGAWYILQARETTSTPISGLSGSSTGNRITLSFNGGTAPASQISREIGHIYYIKGTINNGNLTLYVKDETEGTEETITGTYTVTTGQSVDICLFGNVAGNYIDINSDVYFARIKEDDNYIMDYVPCRQDTTAGFYDKATNTFKTTTNLGAGADVTPTPDTPMDIVCNNGVIKVSSNLFDNASYDDYYYILAASGQLAHDDNQTGGLMYCSTDYIPVKPNTTYFKSGNFGAGTQSYYDENKTYISHESKQNTTFTTPANCSYVKCNLLRTNSPWNTAQIEEGSMATPYRPYGQVYTDGTQEVVTDSLGNTASAERLLAVSDYKDTQEVLTGNVTRNVGIKVLDGTEDWSSVTVGTNQQLFGIDFTNNNLTTDADAIISNNYFQCVARDRSLNNINDGQVKIASNNDVLGNAYARTYSGGNWTSWSQLTTDTVPEFSEIRPFSDSDSNMSSVWDGTGVLTTILNFKFLRAPSAGYCQVIGVMYKKSNTNHYWFLAIDPGLCFSGSSNKATLTVNKKYSLKLVVDTSIDTAFLYYKELGSGNDYTLIESKVSYTLNFGIEQQLRFRNYRGDTPSENIIDFSLADITISVNDNMLFDKSINKIYFRNDNISNVTTWKQWLASQYANGNALITAYPLETATTESVTGQFLSKSPVTQTAGSIDNLPIAITESSRTVPTPQQPLPINCNNGVLGIDNQGNITVTGTTETVEITGKNLFDYEYFYDNYQTYSPSAVGRCPIKLQPNTTYTVSTNKEVYSTSASMFVVSGSAIDWTPNTANNGILVNSPRTVTTDSNGYLCFGLYVTAENAIPESYFINGVVWVQIEQGSTATTYEAYFDGGQATAENLFKVGAYQDVQSVIDGNITRNVGIKVLDGTEGWRDNATDIYCVGIGDAGIFSNRFAPISNHFVGTDALNSDMPDNSIKLGTSNYFPSMGVIFVKNTTVGSLEQFKQYLADQYANGTPVIVIYPLATATTETVTGQPLTIQEGTNIVEITQASIDNLGLEVSYKATV